MEGGAGGISLLGVLWLKVPAEGSFNPTTRRSRSFQQEQRSSAGASHNSRRSEALSVRMSMCLLGFRDVEVSENRGP